MKSFLLFLCFLLLAYAAGAQTKDALIRALDRHNADVLVRNDTAALQVYLAPDFLLNTSGNTVSFGAGRIVAAIRSGRLRYTRFEVVTDTVYFPKKRTAISMGSETAVFGSEGPLQGAVQKRRYTNIWVKEGRTWKLKARHSSIICQEKN